MYNDEENLYHYSYRKNGEPVRQYYANVESEPFRSFTPSTPVQEMKPSKKRGGGAKIVALALCCALLGGAVGGGAVWTAARRAGGTAVRETTIQISGRTAGDAAPVSTIAPSGSKTPLSFEQIYDTQVGSVVSIDVTGESGYNVFGQVVPSASSGSGFILTADGYIVTNYHVVNGGKTVKVTLYNGETYDAKVIGGDEDYDIAVLKIDGENFQPVTLGDSGLLHVGAVVSAIGNPLGELTFSMSEGIASSVNRTINVDGTPFNMIQVTCAINPGNSGGPLFNQYGEVVGIVSAKYSSYSTTTVEGLGFAIPINDVLSMIEDIMTNGYVANKPYLGISAGSMTAQMAAQYRYDISEGVFIFSVEEGGAAEKAGLQMGDVITKVDGTEIKSLEDLNAAKKRYSVGDTVTLTIYRGGESITKSLTFGAVPPEQQTASVEEAPAIQQPDGGQRGGTYTFPFNDDFFNYFFGNGFGFGR